MQIKVTLVFVRYIIIRPSAEALKHNGVDDMRHVFASGYGVYLSKKSERLVVKQNGQVLEEIPFFKIEEVTVDGRGVSISSDLIEQLSKQGIQVNFLTFGGKPYAKIVPAALSATVDIRRAQLRAYDTGLGASFALAVVSGKINNQANLLRYFAKYLKKKKDLRAGIIDEIVLEIKKVVDDICSIEGKNIDEIRQRILTLEAKAGKLYWKGVKTLLFDKAEFDGRHHVGAKDAVNSVLNYGYGILYSRVWGALLLAGLEPFGGFLHVDRPGKPSLVLDMVEEFRQPIIDRYVISRLNKGKSFKRDDEGLTLGTRKEIASGVNSELERVVKFCGKNQKQCNIIQIQARSAASFFRGKGIYEPYKMKW